MRWIINRRYIRYVVVHLNSDTYGESGGRYASRSFVVLGCCAGLKRIQIFGEYINSRLGNGQIIALCDLAACVPHLIA